MVDIYRDIELGNPAANGGKTELTPDEVDRLRSLCQAKLIADLDPRLLGRYRDPKVREEVRRIIAVVVSQNHPRLNVPVREGIIKKLTEELHGYGPLDRFLDDPDITEILVYRWDRVDVEKDGGLTATDASFQNEEHLRQVIERIVVPAHRRIDESSPIVDCRLPDGSRVHAVIPDIAVDGATLTIRKFKKGVTMERLVEWGTLPGSLAAWLADCAQKRVNVLISGGTGSGKCLTGDTPLALAGGRAAAVGELVERKLAAGAGLPGDRGEVNCPGGEDVLTWDPATRRVETGRVERWWRLPAPAALVKVTSAAGRSVTVTPEHPFFTLREGAVRQTPAAGLRFGDRLAVPRALRTRGGPVPEEGFSVWDRVLRTETLENHGERYVYDLTVEGTHTFVAGAGGGLVCHNTTLLGAYARCIPEELVINLIEDPPEIDLERRRLRRYQTRPPGLEGTGEVPLYSVVVGALRERPDVIIVGECRSKEAFSMLQAMNTGHAGSITTVHANDAADALDRLVAMAASSGELPKDQIPEYVARSLELVVHVSRVADGSRKVVEVAQVEPETAGGRVRVKPLVRLEMDGNRAVWRGVDQFTRKTFMAWQGMTPGPLPEEVMGVWPE